MGRNEPINPFPHIPTFYGDEGFLENIVGKRKNAGHQHFFLFHNVFYPPSMWTYNFRPHFLVECKRIPNGRVKNNVIKD